MSDKVLPRLLVPPGTNFSFTHRDANEDFGWDKALAALETAELIAKIDALQFTLVAQNQQSLLVVLQAIDAAGKDGTVRNVFGPLSSAGVHVTSFKVPAGSELQHDYLWRVHARAPMRGEIGVWNRSHYEDVLIVRVKDLVPKQRWEKRYRHIREFERMLTDEGTHIVKINLHVSKDEQRIRLQSRVDDPNKRWKFRMGDLDDRKLWPQLMKAYEVAFSETSTENAPWYVVPADRKWVRDLCVARIVHDALVAMHPVLPPDDPTLAGTVVV